MTSSSVQLRHQLRNLCRHNRDGSFATQKNRVEILMLAARQLGDAGFKQMGATSLRRQHVLELVTRWRKEGIAPGTMKNRMAVLRWWAEKINKDGIIPRNNANVGIPDRDYAQRENKAQRLDERLDRITDPYVRMSLLLQDAFGLRREEAIKFQPSFADRVDHIVLKGSWTKGGRERIIPIRTEAQRTLLDAAHKLAGDGALIPPDKSYIQQRNLYDGQCKAAGLSNMHGLRHNYAQERLEDMTGRKAPLAGGPRRRELAKDERRMDDAARRIVAEEMGHSRVGITATYCGT
jgi:integrase